MILDSLFIFLLILANGFFAASEIAIVSARQSQLQTKAEEGNERAKIALHLRQNPTRFLATVQIGITMVATLASAFGGAEAVESISPLIAQLPLLEPYAEQIALGIVVVIISYVTLLIGELVPKRLAFRNPEKLAISVAKFFDFLARIVHLPISILMISTDLVMRLFREDSEGETAISPGEIELLVRRGTAEGVILPVQEKMITRVFDYADRVTRDEMTPRTEIVAFEMNTPVDVALEIAKKHGYSRFPVYRDDLDHISGYVHIKDLMWADEETPLSSLIRPVVIIPEGVSLPRAFTALTKAGRQMGIVLDEYGGTEGLITLENLLEVIVGEIEDEHSPLAEVPERHEEGVWEIAGSTAIVEVGELLGVDFESSGVYNTLAGFIMTQVGEIPQEGDTIIWNDYSFSVEEMERFRILRVRIQHLNAQ